MNEKARKMRRQAIVASMTAILLMSSTGQAKADPFSGDSGNTQQLVGGFVSVLSLAGPEGAAAAMVAGEMKDVMGMLGFFKSPDPVAQALQQINSRLDAIQQRLDQTDQKIEAVQNQVFQAANLQNTRLLRDQSNAIQRVLTGLKDKPADKFTKDQLALQAQQVCDTFLTDSALWMYSDMAAKNISWNGQTYQSGQMTAPGFKPAPTLDVYATALAAWMAAVEYASNGDAASVKSTYTNDLNRHIQFLSTRPTFNEFRDTPQSLPEQVKVKVTGEYVPTSRSPDAGRRCTIAEYVRDDFAREEKLVGNLSYVTQNVTDLCSVPANLLNFASPAEETLESGYGLDVMALLAQQLTYLRDQGTIQHQYMGTFTPTTVDGEYLYKVKPDSILYWQGDNLSISGLKPGERTATVEHITHSLTKESPLGPGWTQYAQIIPGGGSTIYVMTKDGQLQWFSHDGSLTGAQKWRGPTVVGSGWNSFTQIIPMGDGILYGILPDGTLRWNKHNNYRTGQGGYSGWTPAMNVGRGWSGFKTIFGGGNGVIYVVTTDGKLKWYRHDCGSPAPMPGPAPQLPPVPKLAPLPFGMPNPMQTQLAQQNQLIMAPYNASVAKWNKSWQGPKEIGTGWNAFSKLFCAGNGHIYGILPSGEIRGYDHVGWQDGTPRWGDQQKVGDGWAQYPVVFCRMPSGDEDAPVVH